MRIRRLGDPVRPVPAGRPLALFAVAGQVVTPGAVTHLVLDLAASVEPGAAILLLGTEALAAAGISAHPTLRTAADPLGVLTLMTTAPVATPVPEGVPVAIGLVLDAPAETYYEDVALDAAMAEPGLRFDEPDAR
jgi:hypothetical protein